MKPKLLLPIIIGALLLGLQPAVAQAQDFPDVCQQPENILRNCNFDNGLDQWHPFLEEGNASISVLQGGGECHAPLCPAAHIVTDSSFVGGLYQQVPVTAGNTYYANIVWLVFDSLVNDQAVYDAGGGIGRRVGIDPFGGADSRSPDIVWSPDIWRNDCKICNEEQVTVTAQADTITLFLRIDDTWRERVEAKGFSVPVSKDQFWLDDLGLKQVGGVEAARAAETEPPPATDTLLPPPTDTPTPAADDDDTPVAESPTETPEPDTPTPADIDETEPTALQPVSPGQTPAAVSAIVPPPTLTPSMTPPPTDTPEPRPTRAPRLSRAAPPAAEPPVISAGLLGVVGTGVCIGGVVLVLIGAVMTGLVWLYRLGWEQVDDDEFDDDVDDAPEIIIDIVE
ncbi:MAG TPA: hypothetical protein VGD99_16440 [Anaerolineae bacterium]